MGVSKAGYEEDRDDQNKQRKRGEKRQLQQQPQQQPQQKQQKTTTPKFRKILPKVLHQNSVPSAVVSIFKNTATKIKKIDSKLNTIISLIQNLPSTSGSSTQSISKFSTTTNEQ